LAESALPRLFFTGGCGPATGHLPPIEKLVADYYRARGWLPDGMPSHEKLRELGLEKNEAV